MPIITPTVGRVVLFRPGIGFAGIQTPDGDPLPAVISRVWNDRLINIGGFDADGKPFSATSVPLIQGDETSPVPGSYYAEWMPYQKGQAAKTEALEKLTATEARDVFNIRADSDGTVWLNFDGGMVNLNHVAEGLGPLIREKMQAALRQFAGT